MKYRWDNKYLHWGITAFCVIAASMLFYFGIFQMHQLIAGVKKFLSVLTPVIYGAILAYLLCPIVNYIENYLVFPFLKKKEVTVTKKRQKFIRWVCVLFSLVLFLVIIYALIMMILPQLVRSITNIVYSFPYYVNVIEEWLNTIMESGWELDTDVISMLNKYSAMAQDYLTNNLLPQMQEMMKNITSGVFDVLNFVFDFLIGAIVSMYILVDKEVFIARSKMIVYALFPAKHANSIVHAMRFTHKTFGGFISGKILDSAIIGVLCYIGITILDMPYTILVSVIVGVTNVIPFFGPYIGAIPCILLIMLQSPLQGLYFAIFILVLQQFDGNILGPKILGDSTGLSSFMVIVAIMIGGGLFGIPGMIIGVPLCAVIYAFVWTVMGHSLKNKKMPEETVDYQDIDCIDPISKTPIPMPVPEVKERKKITKETITESSMYQKYEKAKPFLEKAYELSKKYLTILYHFTVETWIYHYGVMKGNILHMYKWIREKYTHIYRLIEQRYKKIHKNLLQKYYEEKRKR